MGVLEAIISSLRSNVNIGIAILRAVDSYKYVYGCKTMRMNNQRDQGYTTHKQIKTMKKILFLANSEHGQTNIVLALTHELILHPDIDIHIASFPALRKRVDKLLHDNAPRYREKDISTASRVHFHEVRGPSNTDVFLRTGKRGAFHPPGASGAVLGFKSLIEDIWGWNEEEYVDVYNSCLDILGQVNPDLVVVDFFFLQGRDAAHNMGHTAVLMNTTSLSHIVLGLQKHSSPLWKYPLYVIFSPMF